MFIVKYPDGALFKKIMYGALKPLSEVPLKVTGESLIIRSLSPDKNLLVEIFMPSSSFESFDVTGEVSLVLDRDEYVKTIRRGTKRDTVTLKYEDGSKYVNVLLTNTKTGAERIYQVSILEAGRELIQSLDLDLPVRFQIESRDLKKLVSDAKLIGDELELTYSEGNIIAKCSSEGKLFETSLTLDRPLLSLESREDKVVSKYDVDMLKSIASTFEAADVITVEFGAGLPMHIHFSTEDGAKVSFWVAPRA